MRTARSRSYRATTAQRPSYRATSMRTTVVRRMTLPLSEEVGGSILGSAAR